MPFWWAASRACGDLYREVEELAGVQRFMAGGPEWCAQGLALQQLHNHEGLWVVFGNSVNRADVWVVQCRGSPGFAFKALKGTTDRQ